MKRTLVVVLLVATALLASLAERAMAAGQRAVTSKEVGKQAQQTPKTPEDYTMQEKQEYQQKMEVQLEELSKHIDRLMDKAKTLKEEAGSRLQKTIADLKEKQKIAADRLPELRAGTSKAWGDVKVGVDKAFDDLRKAYEKAKADFQ